jgi:hypothetical protein
MSRVKYCVGGIALTVTLCALLASCGKDSSSNKESGLAGPTVAKVAACASGDKPEPALQGQVPAAERAAGFQGYNCNLVLEGQQTDPDGAGVSFASFKDDHDHYCAYYFGGGFGTGKIDVVDVTDPAKPVLTATLTTKGMQSAGETLRVNAARQLMVGIGREQMGPNGNEMDVYDLSADCRDPKLQWSGVLNAGDNGGPAIADAKPLKGHDSNFSPDGLTFYDGSNFTKTYTAVDLTDPTKPKIVAQMDMSKAPLAISMVTGIPHGLSVSDDGNTGYFTSIGLPQANELKDPNYKSGNGFYVIDISDIQARKPDPQWKVISSMAFRNSSSAQHTLTIKIGGKPYLIFVTEGGSGGIPKLGGGGTPQDACDAGLTPFPMARIIDMADETHPKLVTDLALETHDLRNCSKVMPDTVGEGIFTYGSHICSVDNRENATALACAYFESGIRVFDIRDPAHPKEIAYFNPAPVTEAKKGLGADNPTNVNSCAAPAGFDFERKLLTTACQRSGALVLKFENGVWPFPESTPAPRTVSYN